MGAEPQTRCAGDAGLGPGSPPALSPAPGPNTRPPAWRLGKQAVLGGAPHGAWQWTRRVPVAKAHVMSTVTVCSRVWAAALGGILDLSGASQDA